MKTDNKALLESIRLDTFMGEYKIQIDWSNDRHQAIKLKSLEPEDVRQGLNKTAKILEQEIHFKKL